MPDVFKSALITPLLKKPDLTVTTHGQYQPISNLSVVSKLLECLVFRTRLQSAYRTHHSTETAALKVLADILLAVDNGDLSVLALLDLSAAFNTVDHDILLTRLRVSYGVGGPVLDWFRSYLTGRTECVRRSVSRFTSTTVRFGVPQGSVLGPLLFILYTADLIDVIEARVLHPHLYADDTQIQDSGRTDSVDLLQSPLSDCLDEVSFTHAFPPAKVLSHAFYFLSVMSSK